MPTGLTQSLHAERDRLRAEGNAIQTLASTAGGYSDDQRERQSAILARIGQIDDDIAMEERATALLLDAPALATADTPAISPVPQAADEKPFKSFTEFLGAVRSAAYQQKKGQAVDPRLHQVEATIHGASETVGQDGGFLVQKDQRNDLLESMFAQSNLASRTQPFEVGPNSNGVKFNVVDETSRATGSRWGGVRVYWTAEGGQKTASRPKVKPLEMQLQKLAGLLVATDELLEDSVAYAQFARMAFSEEMAFALDDAIIRGTGAGMPQGILTADATVAVAAEGGQAADSFVAENVWNMYARLPARSLARSEWYINQALIPQIAQLQLAIGTGGVPLYIPAGGLASAPFGTLLGRPVNFIEQASAPGDLGDVILADLKEYLLITKGGIQEASSIHVYFDTDETAFRWVWRVNGAPRWTSAITPFKGTPTISPFVTLAAR